MWHVVPCRCMRGGQLQPFWSSLYMTASLPQSIPEERSPRGHCWSLCSRAQRLAQLPTLPRPPVAIPSEAPLGSLMLV
jgi:hypothetical protein